MLSLFVFVALVAIGDRDRLRDRLLLGRHLAHVRCSYRRAAGLESQPRSYNSPVAMPTKPAEVTVEKSLPCDDAVAPPSAVASRRCRRRSSRAPACPPSRAPRPGARRQRRPDRPLERGARGRGRARRPRRRSCSPAASGVETAELRVADAVVGELRYPPPRRTAAGPPTAADGRDAARRSRWSGRGRRSGRATRPRARFVEAVLARAGDRPRRHRRPGRASSAADSRQAAGRRARCAPRRARPRRATGGRGC